MGAIEISASPWQPYYGTDTEFLGSTEAEGMHIILVEDDEVCSEIVGAVLARDGMRVTSVSDGAEAIALLDKGVRPDLLLTDIRLPGDCDGWLVARIYKDECPTLPVIYISASQPSTDQVDCSVYLRKPVCPALLLRAVKALTGSGGQPASGKLH